MATELTDKTGEFVRFQINRKITSLSKNTLMLLEDLQLPPEQFQRVRKRVLDLSNDAIRELEACFEKLNITLK